MTSRERLKRAFRCQETDRMPVRLWGVDPYYRRPDPSWQPLYELCGRYELDYIRHGPLKIDYEEQDIPRYSEERPGPHEGVKDIVTVWETPQGPLTSVFRKPIDGSPGRMIKHLIETVEEAQRWLSIPRRQGRLDPQPYREFAAKSGEEALQMVPIGHAMYSVQALMGSEIFGYWLKEERELLHEMISRAYEDIEDIVKQALAADLGDAFGWVGPELCIPPLASPADFREFCVAYDTRLIAMIHEAGKLVWVHCHGDMNPVLEDFIAMGVDCLNPIEPPPVGQLTLAEAKKRCAGRMCLDGGIQNGDFQLLTPEQMARRTEEVIAEGKPGYGFILCPTSDPTTWPVLTERIIENHKVFVETAIRLAPY